MHRTVRTLALVAFAVAACAVVLPGVASAQYREFTGRIDKIDGRKMIVDNRQGDKLTFEKAEEPQVTVQEGAEIKGTRENWGELKKGDWVKVSWKMMDNPRKAYEILVLPPREE
jgi:hypothetical protein